MSDYILKYRAKKRMVFVSSILIFLFAAALFIHCAGEPGYMESLNEIMPGNGTGVAYLYLLALFGFALALFSALGLLLTFINREIVLGTHSLVTPRNPFSHSIVEIKYGEIISHRIERFIRGDTLIINHRGGTARVPESVLAERADFDVLCFVIRLKCPAV